jgi:hypothetical protein
MMELSSKVSVASRALISWHTLPGPIQATILATLEGLAGQPTEQWPGPEVTLWRADEGLYAYRLPVGADETYVFFRQDGLGRVRVEALALRETIERFTGSAGPGAP